MRHQSIVFLSSGDPNGEAEALARLCSSVAGARERLQLLYVGEHHVTGFGATIAHGHIANDMQVRQEIFPLLKRSCARSDIPPGCINVRLGDHTLVIEKFISERDIDLLAVTSRFAAEHRGTISDLAPLLNIRNCQLYVTP